MAIIIPLKNIPFQGGADLAHEIALFETGAFSNAQNVRPTHPGLVQRKGHIKQHTTAADSQETIQLYQFSKGEVNEKKLYRQLADGSLQEATSNPPTVTTGNFGTEKLAAATGSVPACFGNIKDMLIYSDRARQHQINPGDTQKVWGFHVYKGTAAIPDIPIIGKDYTAEVNDGQTSTYAVLDSLNTLANFHVFYVMSPVRANKVTFTVANANTNTADLSMKYRKNDGTYASVTIADGTAAAGKTMAQSGSATWTMPTDEVPHFSFGKSAFIYQFAVSAQLSSDVKLSSVSFGGTFQDIQNVWNGVMVDVPEARVLDVSASKYSTYAGTAVDLSSFSDSNVGTVTITIATPGVVTWTAHKRLSGDAVVFTTTGALPTGLTAGTTYYVIAAGLAADTFQVSATVGGSAINTSGSQSGTHTATVIGDSWYLLTADPVIGFHADPGATPNKTAGTVVGIDIAFVDGGTGDDTITRTAADFMTQGFEIGMIITVSGATTGGNNKDYTIKAITQNKITVQTGMVTAESAGATVKITRANATVINVASVHTGADFTALTNLSDGTNGISQAGFVTFSRNTNAKKINFQGAGVEAYVYKFTTNRRLSNLVFVDFQSMPFYDIDKTHYPIGQSNAVWKGRACYVFKGIGNYLYFSARDQPTVLNGWDGVGRVEIGNSKNDILCMRKFYNELLVWQAEKGEEGGSLTIVEGDAATGTMAFDKKVISPRFGIVNSKSAVVLEGVSIAEMNTDRPIATVAYWISRDGVFKTNGQTFSSADADISNYFDPTKAECIRRGYESKHFLVYDRAYKVIRMGLCSGASATMANKFFVLDPLTGKWTPDVIGQALSCLAEIEGDSGDIIVLQMGGGQDGYVYQVNTTNSDVSTAIDSSITMEINGKGERIRINKDTLRCKVQAAGNIVRTIMADGNPAVKDTKTLTMTAKNANDVYRRHYKKNKIDGDHLTIKWRHNTAGEACHFLDFGIEIESIDSTADTSDT